MKKNDGKVLDCVEAMQMALKACSIVAQVTGDPAGEPYQYEGCGFIWSSSAGFDPVMDDSDFEVEHYYFVETVGRPGDAMDEEEVLAICQRCVRHQRVLGVGVIGPTGDATVMSVYIPAIWTPGVQAAYRLPRRRISKKGLKDELEGVLDSYCKRIDNRG